MRQWPDGVEFAPDSAKPTFVMFAHPRCPCTRASLRELALTMTKCDDRIRTYVLFVRPNDVGSTWAETDLKRQAEAIPGVTVVEDRDGRYAERFRIRTSGETLLYDETGRLRFCGGITPSRGHNGDNIGREAILSLVLKREETHSSAPVFGCPLLDQPDQAAPTNTIGTE